MKEITKHYSNGELTIKWQPAKCVHAGECVRTLPQVYHPRERPWIKIENATTDELKAQVQKCPTGALSYFMNNESDQEAESLATKVEVMPNGPLLTDKDGNESVKNKTTAFCRCGQSKNKPYCDGAHVKSNFID